MAPTESGCLLPMPFTIGEPERRSTRLFGGGLGVWGAVLGAVALLCLLAPGGPPAATDAHSAVLGRLRVPTLHVPTGRAAPSLAAPQSPALAALSREVPSDDSAPAAPAPLPTSGLLGGAFLVTGVLLAFSLAARPRLAMAAAVGDKGTDPEDNSNDARSERHRVDQRVVFSNERWRKHRSDSRFARSFFNIPNSFILQHVLRPVIAITAFTTVLCVLRELLGVPVFNLPTSLFSLSAPSLGLLLVFRTNASYERWDGARKMIGLVKNRSEDLTRQMSVRFPADRKDLKDQFLRYTQAFFFALKVHLRSGPGGFEDDENLIEDLTPILKPEELQLALKATNRPGHIMHCMTQIIKAANQGDGALFCIDQNLTTLADVLGGCERILKTPIPLSYTRMTSRFVFVWLLLLPFAMTAEFQKLDNSVFLAIPSMALISFALLGVEEVAVQIEEPFTILPMEAYAAGSKGNTSSIYAQMEEVDKLIQ